MIIRYTVPEIWCMTDVLVIFDYGLFFVLLPPLTAQKIKILKKRKKHLEISCTKNYDKIITVHVRYGARQTDGQTDGWKK